MFDYTVLWESEDGELYSHDFTANSMNEAVSYVKNHSDSDMWDACVEIQTIGEVDD